MASDVIAKPHQLIASDRVEGTAVRRGDRAKEAELHRYYGMPPYWSGF